MLSDLLEDFKAISGYKAAAILDSTGEVLISDASNLKGDLDMAVAIFNDIFSTGHKTVTKLSLGMMKNMQFMTSDGVILMECSELMREFIYICLLFWVQRVTTH